MKKKAKNIFYIITLLLILGLSFLMARGPFISNFLENLIIPELETASGKKVGLEKIYLNLFPLFIEAKNITIYSHNIEDKILTAKKIRAYIDISGILGRFIALDRILIEEPQIKTEKHIIEEIIKNIQKYLKEEKKPKIKVKLKVLEIIKGKAGIKDENLKSFINLEGIKGEIIVRRNPRLLASVEKISLERPEWPKIDCYLKTFISLKDNFVELKHLEIRALGSSFEGSGFSSKDEGILKTQIALLMESVKHLFKLSQKGDGKIDAHGKIKIPGYDKLQGINLLEDIFIDLKVSGNLYLQTLMEFLKVKEKIEGHVNFGGEVKGSLSDISADGKVNLRKGNLFGVDVDALTCKISYDKGIMKFENGRASLYNGTAIAKASINLPVVNFFTLDVIFKSIDSNSAFELIGWNPEIAAGKVDGHLTSSGQNFNPDGWFIYKSSQKTSKDNDILHRIRDIKGTYFLRNKILYFSNLQISSLLSDLYINGEVDLKDKKIGLKSRLVTNDISEITSPYYSEIRGHGSFSGDIVGTFQDPKIIGTVTFSNVILKDYSLNSITTDLAYEKELLQINKFIFKAEDEEHALKGKISFPQAKKLFDFSLPVYNLSSSVNNAKLEKLIKLFNTNLSIKGNIDAEIFIKGGHDDLNIFGKATIDKASVSNIPFDFASMNFKYLKNDLSLENVKIKRGDSIIRVDGKIESWKRFSYTAYTKNVFLKDFGLIGMPKDAILELESNGKGTFDNPLISLKAKVSGGTFKGRNIGSGNINATIKNRKILLQAALFNERMKLEGTGYLTNDLPWSAEVEIQPGRYDFIISAALKDIPEDLILNVEGRILMNGDKKHINASTSISHLTLTLFEQTFTNVSDIKITLQNDNLFFKDFSLQSGVTSFKIEGGLEIGKNYDLLIEGSSTLAPLKGFSQAIGYLKGETKFNFSIKGMWDKPEIDGSMNISNASFGMKDYPVYISSINGYLYIDKNRIVIEKIKGKIGGGDINISGLVYLKAFQMDRFHLEADFKSIKTEISEDFNINFSGDLVYKGTKDNQSITGDININRARYKKNIEWKTWLLTAKTKQVPKVGTSALEKASLNIRMTGADNISIDNNIASAPVVIRGDMIVKGTVSNPVLLGRLESTEGYVYFRNNEFKIIHASADFIDPHRIKPLLNLTAETEVKGYNIRLNLEGQIDRFNLSLSSDPHLEEIDILALLTVGQIGKQLKGLEGGIGAGEATSFITGKVQDVLQERIRTLTGLDRFQIETSVSKTTSAVEPRVTVSERLIGNKLFVTYTTSLGSVEEQIVKLEYLVGKNISLIGIRDERGSIGGDIKFRFEFR